MKTFTLHTACQRGLPLFLSCLLLFSPPLSALASEEWEESSVSAYEDVLISPEEYPADLVAEEEPTALSAFTDLLPAETGLAGEEGGALETSEAEDFLFSSTAEVSFGDDLLGVPEDTPIQSVQVSFQVPVTPLVGEPVVTRIDNGDGTNTLLGRPRVHSVIGADATGAPVTLDSSLVEFTDVYWSMDAPQWGETPSRYEEASFREGNYYLCAVLEGKNGAILREDTEVSLLWSENEIWDCTPAPNDTIILYFPIGIVYRRITRVDLSVDLGSVKEGDPINRKIPASIASAYGDEEGLDLAYELSIGVPVWYKDSYDFMKPFYHPYQHEQETTDTTFSPGVYYLYIPLTANGISHFARDCEVYVNGEKTGLCTWPYGHEGGEEYLVAIEVDTTGSASLKTLNLLISPLEFFDRFQNSLKGFSHGEEIPQLYFYLLKSEDPLSRPEFVTLGEPYWTINDGEVGHDYANFPPAGTHFTDHLYVLNVDVQSKVPIAEEVRVIGFNSVEDDADQKPHFLYFRKTGTYTGRLVSQFYTGEGPNVGDFTLDMRSWDNTPTIPLNNYHVADRLSISLCCLPNFSDAIAVTHNGFETFDLDKDGHDDLIRHDMIRFSVSPTTNLKGKAYTVDFSALDGQKLHVDSVLQEYYGKVTFLFPDADILGVTLPEKSYTYTGEVIHPVPTVTLNGEDVLPASEYDVSYDPGCTNVGKYKVTVTTKDGLSASAEFKIKARSLSAAKITLKPKSFTYNGKYQTPLITVSLDSKKLKENTDYTVQIKGNKNAGEAKVTITGTGNYKGQVETGFTIKKATQNLTVKAKPALFSAVSLRKKKQSIKVEKYLTIKRAKGLLSFKKASGSTKFTVDETTGKLYSKAGTKKGDYTIKVKVTSAATKNYKKASVTVTVGIKVL